MKFQAMIQIADGVGHLLTTGGPGEPGPDIGQGGQDGGHQDGRGHQEAVVISHRGQGHPVTQEARHRQQGQHQGLET